MEKLLEALLSRLKVDGSLEVQTASGRVIKIGNQKGPDLAIRITDKAAEFQLLRDPELALGELYMDGRLIVVRGTIYEVINLALSNFSVVSQTPWLKALQGLRTSFRRWRQRNNPIRSRRNVAHHYDLDGRLYSLFLDPDRQYSCAYFEHPAATLEEAQLAKKRHIAAKLMVEPDQSVLDIGCGWGGMALYLADYCGAKVTGVTLSQEQLGVAKSRAVERQLADHVDFRLQDYRAVDEKFDRIVSVGMFEHVGVGYYDIYFRKVAEMLKADGVGLIHTIGRAEPPCDTAPWIDKYIFPGGYIPSLSEMMPAIERAGLIVTDIEILRIHYAETLKAWRDRFMARWDEAAAIYDQRFCRMWEFYLAASEASFRLGMHVVFQIQLAHNVNVLPLTRDYIGEREAHLRALDSSRPDLRLAGE